MRNHARGTVKTSSCCGRHRAAAGDNDSLQEGLQKRRLIRESRTCDDGDLGCQALGCASHRQQRPLNMAISIRSC